MVLQGRGLLGWGSQLVGFCVAEPGLCISLCCCKVALDGEDTTSMGYVCGWVCQISGVEPGELFSRQGNFLGPLIPSVVGDSLVACITASFLPTSLGLGRWEGCSPTRTRASVRLVQTAISSLVLMSG